jgi:hypothetical protein
MSLGMSVTSMPPPPRTTRMPSPATAAGPSGPEPGASGAVLFAVPFLREPSRLVCAITGLHLYLETLEGSAALLSRWSERLDR